MAAIFRILSFLMLVWVFTSCGGTVGEKYSLGRDDTWSPLDLMGQEPAVTAFSDNLVMEIASLEGFQVTIYPARWEALMPLLRNGELDAVFSSLSMTPENRQLYDFSDPYLSVGPVLVVPYQSSVTLLEQMTGKTVGVQSGSSAVSVVTQIPSVVIKYYDNVTTALDDLYHHRIDGVVMEILIAQRFCNDLYQQQLKVATPPLTDEALRLMVRKGKAPELLQKFNAGLNTLKESGAYRAMQKKWDIED